MILQSIQGLLFIREWHVLACARRVPACVGMCQVCLLHVLASGTIYIYIHTNKQIWAWERFVHIRPTIRPRHDAQDAEPPPLACRYEIIVLHITTHDCL